MNNNTINNDMTMGVVAPAGGAKRFRAGDEILERYVVESELGQGGMGVVYLCLDKIGGVKVAVKGLPPEVSHNSDEMESVRENFQLVSELQHPNIAGVRTLEKDATTGDYYLVMAYARGMSLKQWLRQHGGKEHRAEHLNVLRQIASALDYAHNAEPRHIIHRDIKPENVMVDEHGNVAVLDFGLAAQVRSSLSRVSQIVTSRSGTPVYKSPEQWLAQAQRAPSDQYSLGVIAYQMFAGELPYDSDDIEILKHAVVFDPVPPIQGEDKVVNAVFAKALAKKPQERFASCAAFVAALGGSCVPRDRDGSRKSRLAAVLLSVLAIGALVVGGWWWRERVKNEELRVKNEVLAADRTRQTKQDAVTPAAVQTVPVVPSVSEVAQVPKPGEEKTITLPGGATMEMVWCPPGSFMMGSPQSENPRDNDETQHRVTLTRGFWMGKYEVTQRQWESVMGENPSSFKGVDRPVETVSWDDCQQFIQKINAAGQVTVSLPTEAQWEYACRAGSTTSLPNGKTLRVLGENNGPALDEIAWYGGNSSVGFELPDGVGCSGWKEKQYSGSKAGTHPVGQKKPNDWGLYDMIGNVWEWCADWYGKDYYAEAPSNDPTGPASGAYRVYRGGSWSNYARNCRSAYRSRDEPGYRSIDLGFRLVCSAGPRR